MINSPSFEPVLPLAWLLAVVTLLLLFFTWQEARRPYPIRWLRVIAQAVAIIALVGLLLRPSWPTQLKQSILVVLTRGYSVWQVDSLKRSDPSLRFVRAPGAAALAGSDSAASYREVSKLGSIRYVVGEGFPLAYLDGSEGFRFLAGKPPRGIVQLNTGTFPANRRSWIHGTVREAKGSLLVLRGPGGIEDSLKIRLAGEAPFDLGFVAKTPGKYVYSLTVTDASGASLGEEVPIEVAGDRLLSVLILQTYPQAEARFLKNFLSAKGHRLVTRYRLSKGVYRHEFANGATEKIGALTQLAMGTFDLLITDVESIESLSGTELRELEASVTKGLGLLMLLREIPDKTHFPGNVLQLNLDATALDTVRFRLGRYGSFVGPFAATKSSGRIQVVLRSGLYALQGFALSGDGKVGYCSLGETYRLGLGGDNSAYAALWSPLLEQVARREDASVKVGVVSPFPIYPDEPVNVEVIGGEDLTLTDAQGISIPLAENVRIDNLWHGTFRPPASGWTTLSASYTTQAVFVSKPGAWPSVRAENQRKANALAGEDPGSMVADQVIKEEVPRWIFFLIFVMAMGVVWMGPKL